MAERLRKMHQDDVRLKIKTSQLLNRLSDHALNGLEMSATQIRAIEVLLKKVLPDLQAIEHSGEVATGPAYDLSAVGDEALAQLEGALAASRPVSVGTTGKSKTRPDSVH
jgi:hypothetical protein